MITKMFKDVNEELKVEDIVPLAYKGVQFFKVDKKHVVAAFGQPLIPKYWKMEVNGTIYYLYRTGDYFYILANDSNKKDADIAEIRTTIMNEENAIWVVKYTTLSSDHGTIGYFKHKPSVKEVDAAVIRNQSYEVFEMGWVDDVKITNIYKDINHMLENVDTMVEAEELYLGMEADVFKTYLV